MAQVKEIIRETYLDFPEDLKEHLLSKGAKIVCQKGRSFIARAYSRREDREYFYKYIVLFDEHKEERYGAP